jgi:hypothetical protein
MSVPLSSGIVVCCDDLPESTVSRSSFDPGIKHCIQAIVRLFNFSQSCIQSKEMSMSSSNARKPDYFVSEVQTALVIRLISSTGMLDAAMPI